MEKKIPNENLNVIEDNIYPKIITKKMRVIIKIIDLEINDLVLSKYKRKVIEVNKQGEIFTVTEVRMRDIKNNHFSYYEVHSNDNMPNQVQILSRKFNPYFIKYFTFYKDNKKDADYKVNLATIINEFYQTKESKFEMPFERLILNFMSVKYGAFNTLSDKDWKDLFIADGEYKEQNLKKKPS